MLEPKYQIPPEDLIEAVNSGELVFFVIGYVEASPFVLVEWASGLDETSAIVGESLYRDGELLISQPGNELRQSLATQTTKLNYKANLNLPIDTSAALASVALSYGLSQLELTRLNDPSNFVYLKII